MTITRIFSLLAALVMMAAVTSDAQAPRIVETSTGILGLAPGQTAVLNVVDDGAQGSPALFALLVFLDGDGKLLAHKTATLTRAKVESLELPHSGLARLPIRGLIRLFGRTPDQPRPFQFTLELVEDDERTGAVISCPNDFAFAGNPFGRGGVFSCPTDCNIKIVAP